MPPKCRRCVTSLVDGPDMYPSNTTVACLNFLKNDPHFRKQAKVYTLPPTSAAARYHSERVYYQVHEWMGESSLNAEDWGWLKAQNRLEPLTTDLPAAPEDLLRVIRWKCKTDCTDRRCTCRKLGLECTAACGECKGCCTDRLHQNNWILTR